MNFEFEDYCARRKKIWRARFAGTIARAAFETPPPEIWLSIGDDIDYKMAEQIIAQLESEPDAPVIISINSYGGGIYPAIDLHRGIRNHAGPSTAMVPPGGRCHSAAVLVLVAADVRTAAPDAEFFIHSCGSYNQPSNNGRHTTHSLAAASAEFAETDDEIAQLILPRTTFSRWEFYDALRDELWLSSEEAYSRGLIHFVTS